MRRPLVQLVRSVRSIPYRGSGRTCNVCGAEARAFLPFGNPRREEAQCWRCHSLDRHRFMWFFITRQLRDDLQPGSRLLHIAPEACLSSRLRTMLGSGYITADLHAAGVDVEMDITDIQFDDGHFDGICCSHVLEHVEDDHKALTEFFRILKPGGKALLAVPITVDVTYEDPDIVLPEERLQAFGQRDHVRCYGPDFLDRVAAAGFRVSRITPLGQLSADDRLSLGITEHAGDIFLAERPPA
jgi:SAM-dependent methyltransferase